MSTLTITPNQPVIPVPVQPGDELTLQGQWRVSSRDLVIDGCQSGPSQGAAVGHGAFDLASGGFRIASRDWRAHSCRLVATGEPAPACEAAGIHGPCLPSRLRELANGLDVPMGAEEFRSELTGGMRAELPVAAMTPVSMARTAASVGLGALVLGLAFAGARLFGRRRAEPHAVAARNAKALAARLRVADPVYRDLAPAVEALAEQARELGALRTRLQARVAGTDRSALVARKQELDARALTNEEAMEASALAAERLRIFDQWSDEEKQVRARLDRIVEYLQTLAARLDDAQDTKGASRTGVRVEDDTRVLRELEHEVQLALDGAREAERVLG